MRKIGQKVGNRYRAQVRDPLTGERVSIYAGTQSELETRVRNWRSVKDALAFGDIDPREAARRIRPARGIGLTVRTVWEHYRPGVSVASERAADTAWRRIEPLLGSVLAVNCTENVCREFVAKLEKVQRGRDGRVYAPKTVSSTWDWLSNAMRAAVRSGMLDAVPWGEYAPRLSKDARDQRPATAAPSQLFEIFAAARREDEGLWARERYSAAFFSTAFLGLTALRQAEAAGLAWESVDIDEPPHLLRVRFQATRGWKRRAPGPRPLIVPKGKRARTAVLHPSLVPLLREQRAQLQRLGVYRLDGPVFPADERGGWRTCGWVLRPSALRRFVAQCGLPAADKWAPHSLRHSAATIEAIRHGGDLRAVQQRTGHASLAPLEGYIHSAGHGLAQSAIPELPMALTAPIGGDVVVLPEAPAPKLLPPAPPSTSIVLVDAEEPPEAPPSSAERPRTFVEHAREWVRNPGKGPRPQAVTAAARAAYARAYQVARYQTADKDVARAAGRRAQKAALASWGKALRAAKRQVSAAPVGEATG